MKRVLVTGATGFIGRHVVPYLLDRGWSVRAVSRRLSGTEPAPIGAEFVQIHDIGPETDWSAALDDVCAVLHLAGRAHVLHDTGSDPLSAYRHVNVDGTRRLLQECIRRGVQRFVYMSSVKAVGEGTTGQNALVYTESSECHPLDPYGVSKYEAEQIIREVGERSSLETVILRPPLVYGPGVTANFRRLLQAVTKGLPLPFGSVHNRRSMVYVGNLAHAVCTAMDHSDAAGHTFFVADREVLSTGELVNQIGLCLNRSSRLLPVPTGLLILGGAILGRRADVGRLVGSLEVSTQAIAEVLGWSPPYSVADGLLETVRWFQQTGGNTPS